MRPFLHFPAPPNHALQRTEAGGRLFSVYRVLLRQPLSLSLSSLGQTLTPNSDTKHMEPDDSSKRPVPDLPIFLLAGVAAIFFAYLGALLAGSGPGGWNIHMLFVLPLVVFVGLFTAGVSVFAALPFPRSSPAHFLVLAAINSVGSAFAAFTTIKLLSS